LHQSNRCDGSVNLSLLTLDRAISCHAACERLTVGNGVRHTRGEITMVGKLPIAFAVILDELQTPQGKALLKLID
jgi:hypothetical protein